MNDKSYNTVIMIMICITILPLTLMFGVSPLTVLHIYPIVLRRISIKEVEVSPSEYLDSGVVPITVKTESHYKKPLHMKPLIFTSALIFIGFLIVHVFSIMSFIQYGKEVLSSKDYHSIIPITHAVLSLLAIVVGFGLTVTCLRVRISKQQQQQQKNVLLIPAAAISVNFIYIGCYFMPYMLLAFIHDPLLTTFTYLKLVLFIVCIYLICLGVCNLYKFKHKNYGNNIKLAKFLDKLLYSCMVWAMAFSLMMFLFVVICIILLGSFNDLKDLKYLTSSLPLVVVSLFLLKPVYALLSTKNEDASNRREKKECVQGTESSDDNRSRTTESSDDNQSHTTDSDSQTQVLPDN